MKKTEDKQTEVSKDVVDEVAQQVIQYKAAIYDISAEVGRLNTIAEQYKAAIAKLENK